MIVLEHVSKTFARGRAFARSQRLLELGRAHPTQHLSVMDVYRLDPAVDDVIGRHTTEALDVW